MTLEEALTEVIQALGFRSSYGHEEAVLVLRKERDRLKARSAALEAIEDAARMIKESQHPPFFLRYEALKNFLDTQPEVAPVEAPSCPRCGSYAHTSCPVAPWETQ